jgi:tyrosyl-DNA phosphodiesterase 1
MTNAYYLTPPLPLKSENTPTAPFETFLLEYFSFYGPSRTRDLVTKLKKYDFSDVKAHFVASVPGKHQAENEKKWGLNRLRKVLKTMDSSPNTEVFAQVLTPPLPS